MINFVRKVVAGPKNRTVEEDYDLDLTYITENIIAMAFPASGFEKTYRNSIDDVAKFLKEKHQDNYLIINASNRKYEYEKFNFQVLEFFWTDHQAPPITTLFEVTDKMNTFLMGSYSAQTNHLENPKNVVAVHCNHGKGRTGTAIIAYLIYSNHFKDVETALKSYNSIRFSGDTYGVDQPCQLRYLKYFKSFCELPISALERPLVAYKLIQAFQQSSEKNRDLYLRISETRTEKVIYEDVPVNSECCLKFSRPLFNDIFIEVYESGWSGTKKILRINFNMFFLQKSIENEQTVYHAHFKGKEVKMKEEIKDFRLYLTFMEYCHCHNKHGKESKCLCTVKRDREQTYWDNMCKVIRRHRTEMGLDLENPNQPLKELKTESKAIFDSKIQMN